MIRERVKSGPPLYWTVTAEGNGQLDAAYLASNPEHFHDRCALRLRVVAEHAIEVTA
jgi:hypothetical protein